MTDTHKTNYFLHAPLPVVFLKTAAPIILIMLVNGSFSLVDAYFLGVFVGADALTAVTSMFPAFILIVALSTLVSNGFASLMARQLGAGEYSRVVEVFSQAISLSLVVSGVLIGLFLIGGHALTAAVSHGSGQIADMGYRYIAILVFCSPLVFILAINSNSLRCEGRVLFMSVVSLSSVLFNGLFNYWLIVGMHWGVAGSAWGTVLAQAMSLVMVFLYRKRHRNKIKLQVVLLSRSRQHWLEFLSLGAPSSLNYIGLALTSGAILYNLQTWDATNYATTVGAYGIITRLMTFIFLPLLGLSMAFQAIVGNNVGANQLARVNASIKIALAAAFVYCLCFQAIAFVFRRDLGALFVSDQAVIEGVVRILPFSTLALFLVGPQMMISMFFQAIGDARRAGILGIMKTYAFSLPLIFILPLFFSEWGIWYAAPITEGLALILTILVLSQRSRVHNAPYGLFYQVNTTDRLLATKQPENG
ncbi:Multidrug export protein MepA [Marinomonas spartinae]|uniref:Multidrug export protein MepA n=1 Tax=Marinomonas spartinae TaxID=1792290 RepID=A0A1A8TQH7_9GAMM|nr:MATE family efflux transporter [Marinomonas spartinae]SBS35064.1 Multidrug export protein MepA [Marinomonas spartinae]